MNATTSPNDWRGLNLDQGGRSLIEASAGTGKTWTIAVLYLRLLLEQALGPRQIVVTTFTDAAASELRERLRDRLPKNGAIRMLVITEKQYESIEILLGELTPADAPFESEVLSVF